MTPALEGAFEAESLYESNDSYSEFANISNATTMVAHWPYGIQIEASEAEEALINLARNAQTLNYN